MARNGAPVGGFFFKRRLGTQVEVVVAGEERCYEILNVCEQGIFFQRGLTRVFVQSSPSQGGGASSQRAPFFPCQQPQARLGV